MFLKYLDALAKALEYKRLDRQNLKNYYQVIADYRL